MLPTPFDLETCWFHPRFQVAFFAEKSVDMVCFKMSHDWKAVVPQAIFSPPKRFEEKTEQLQHATATLLMEATQQLA